MKLRILVLGLLAACGSACTSMDKPRSALRVEPIMAIRHGGPDGQAYYQLGRYYEGQRRLEAAEKAYLQAIAADERNIAAFDALGRLYAERGELERSVQAFEKGAAQGPEVAYIHNNLGFAYYLRGEFDKAQRAVSKALRLDPGLARGWSNLELIAAASAETAPVETLELPGQEEEPAPVALQDGQRILGGKFVLVAAEWEIVSNGGTLELPPAKSAGRDPVAARPAPIATIRVEVANGNGVTGFARQVASHLRSNSVQVTRITNHASFSLGQTEIQFAPRHEGTARMLALRFNLGGRLIAAPATRSGIDIRIVLGRDAIHSGSLAHTSGSLANS